VVASYKRQLLLPRLAGSRPLPDMSTSLVRNVSEDDARRRRASRVPNMCPACVRVFVEWTTTKCRFTGTLGKPSDGLEPSTPSLPWKFWCVTRVHTRSLATQFLLQIGLNLTREIASRGVARVVSDVSVLCLRAVDAPDNKTSRSALGSPRTRTTRTAAG
jgi:hypothetical protein